MPHGAGGLYKKKKSGLAALTFFVRSEFAKSVGVVIEIALNENHGSTLVAGAAGEVGE